MKERFDGAEGRRRLIGILRQQKAVQGNEAIATAIASTAELRELVIDEVLIEENAHDTDIYFLLSGELGIYVKGRKIADRHSGEHVGEMSAINPALPRSATVRAAAASVVAKISETALTDIANAHPDVWRAFAAELARRLAQRNALVPDPNEKPRIFLISSKEALPIAREIQSALSHEFLVAAWTDGVFFASGYPLEILEQEVDKADFAIAVAQPDDRTEVRGTEYASPRDNVIFELGLFMGRLGRERTFLFQPLGKELKLPSDLHGLVAISYKTGQDSDLPALLASPCHEVRKVVKALGVKRG